jgi:hypothetical protein
MARGEKVSKERRSMAASKRMEALKKEKTHPEAAKFSYR